MHAFKRILLSGIIGFCSLGTASAADFLPEQFSSPADPAWYLRADVGWSFLDWNGGNDDNNVTFGGGIGYRYSEHWRTDIRIDFAGDFNVGGGRELNIGTALVNGYFDIPLGGQITPYVGLGVGYGWADLDPGQDRSGFAYALMTGASFDMTQNIALDVGYRYRGIADSGPDVADHSVLAGFRFTF